MRGRGRNESATIGFTGSAQQESRQHSVAATPTEPTFYLPVPTLESKARKNSSTNSAACSPQPVEITLVRAA